VTHPHHASQPIQPAAGCLSVYGVLETPPLPVTPPPCENRWHHTMAESSLPWPVQQYNLRPRVAITASNSAAWRCVPRPLQ
jgi:hypothetical protein